MEGVAEVEIASLVVARFELVASYMIDEGFIVSEICSDATFVEPVTGFVTEIKVGESEGAECGIFF